MRARLVLLLVAILLVAGFAALNWGEFMRTSPLNFGLFQTDAVHSVTYGGRRISVRASGVREYAFRAFVDGWPVSNRRRGAPGGFPSIDEAVGRCKVVIDAEAPARRWRRARRLLQHLRSVVNRAAFGDRRGPATGSFSGPAAASGIGYPQARADPRL